MKKIFRKLACWAGRHDLQIVRPLSKQAAQVECSHCHRQWAMKMEGDNAGAKVPWEKAKEFYTEYRIASALGQQP